MIESLLLWIAYSVFEGMREARYWHVKIDYKGFRVFKEHMYWTFQRGIVLIMICQVTGYWVIIPFSMMFPFFHDGAYYWQRNVIDGIYQKGWWDQSTTSTAYWTEFFTPIRRTWIAIMGLIVYFAV